MKEIGSEYSLDNLDEARNNNINSYNGEFVFSGRTAIEMVLKNEKFIRKALLPSYCCDSMIEPFRKAKIEVDFYSVKYEEELKIDLKIEDDVDCILWCNYFGFNYLMPNLSSFIKSGGIIIEDITHSFYSKNKFHEQSTYLVASLRKWEPIICGGYVSTKLSNKKVLNLMQPPNSFLEKKKHAMLMKKEYLLDNSSVSKQEFLNLFSETNKWLANNYSRLSIDEYSKNYLMNIDYKNHREQRIKNAKILYEGLRDCFNIQFLFSLDDMDCPLFVPIIVTNGKRNEIRNRLIENQIYCPIHWPHPNDKCCESNLYDLELSLVCDHRYNENDMQRIVDVLCNYKGRGKKI